MGLPITFGGGVPCLWIGHLLPQAVEHPHLSAIPNNPVLPAQQTPDKNRIPAYRGFVRCQPCHFGVSGQCSVGYSLYAVFDSCDVVCGSRPV